MLRKSATRSSGTASGNPIIAAAPKLDAAGKLAAAASEVTGSGYDFIEGSGFVIEGLEDKGLDAKSYIQQQLKRTENSSREEQIIQKEQILAELQRVERELQVRLLNQTVYFNLMHFVCLFF